MTQPSQRSGPAEPQRSRSADLYRPRWQGERGRLEVWYATCTDQATRTGVWVHHEVVAPVEGDPYGHGWAGVFRAGKRPELARFGPHPVSPGGHGDPYFAGSGAAGHPQLLRGETGSLGWHLQVSDGTPPLYTFPAWAWQRRLLPAAQVVAAPAATFEGQVRVGGESFDVFGPGAVARIYGHGNAARWAWLHADLGGGNVLEVVTAVSRRPGMRRLRPLPFVQLRLDGQDWPRDPLLAALRFRAEPALPTWHLAGRVAGRTLEVEVSLPPSECVRVDYRDPDGAAAQCTNTERAWATVRLREGHRVREWRLDGTAHAEVGLRD